MTWLIAIYLLVGALREASCVLYYKAVSANRPLRASGLAGGLELYDYLVLSTIAKHNWNFWMMLAYTIGVIVGTYKVIKRSS